MARYSEKFKKSIVRIRIIRGTQISEETGISIQALYSWIRKLREDVEMNLEGTNPEALILRKVVA